MFKKKKLKRIQTSLQIQTFLFTALLSVYFKKKKAVNGCCTKLSIIKYLSGNIELMVYRKIALDSKHWGYST